MIKSVVFDLDGVLRIGNKAIPGANDVLQQLEKKNIPFMICTNECRFTPAHIREMLSEMGIEANCDIYTAGCAVRDFLYHKYYKQTKNKPLQIGIVGEAGLESLLQTDWLEVHLTPPAGDKFLIVGTITKIEMRHLEKIRSWIHSGAKVITTCCDLSDPSSRGEFLSGMPNLLIHMACGTVAEAYSTGKPNPIVARAIMKILGTSTPESILFVGDTLYTDIKMAEENGFKSALVLSGNSKQDTLNDYVTSPDYIIDSITDVPGLISYDSP
jgi:HAD superfamily hydrolase (TIGR01450 family)